MSLLEQLQSYQPIDATEICHVQRTIAFLQSTLKPFDRQTQIGHMTASAIVVTPDYGKILLLHHRKLDGWLQPGGHCDGDSDTLAVAMREVQEETGLVQAIPATAEIFDVDVHCIPASGGVPEHWHYDIRYLLLASEQEPLQHCEREALDLQWFPLSQLTQVSADRSLHRVAHKLTERLTTARPAQDELR